MRCSRSSAIAVEYGVVNHPLAMSANDHNQLDDFFTSPSLSAPDPSEKPRRNPWRRAMKFFPSGEQFLYLPRVMSRIERYFLILFVLIAFGAFLALPISAYYHYTKAVPDFGGSWIEGAIGTPQHINPLLQTNDVESDLVSLVYGGLMAYDGNGMLVPDMAESYEISDDGLQYTFHLKRELFWHDGLPVTSDDVVFTIQLIRQRNPLKSLAIFSRVVVCVLHSSRSRYEEKKYK